MSNDKFSLDDILKEYPKKDEKKSSDFDKYLTSVKGKNQYKPEPMSFTEEFNLPPSKKKIYEQNSSLNKYKEQENKKAEKSLEPPSMPGINSNDIPEIVNKKIDVTAPPKPEIKHSGNTEILENILKIKKPKPKTVPTKTARIPVIARKKIEDINLNLEGKILPNTEQIPVDKESVELHKLEQLYERRKEKIKDFVLDAEIDEKDKDIDYEDEEEFDEIIDEFESFEHAVAIQSDINFLKRTLSMRFLILLILGLVSTYLVVANERKLPFPVMFDHYENATNYILAIGIIGIIALFTCFTVVSSGLSKLFKMKADADSVSALGIVVSVLVCALNFTNPVFIQAEKIHLFVPIAIISLLFNTIGKMYIVNRTNKNFKFISGDNERYSVSIVEDEDTSSQFTRGTLSDFPVLAAMRKTDFLTDFLKESYSSDLSDRLCKYAVPFICGIGTILSIVAAMTVPYATTLNDKIFVALSTLSGVLSITSCFSLMLVVNIPLSKSADKQLQNNSAMLGYKSVEEFSDVNSLLLDASQLFPQGMITLSAIKIFSDTRIDEAIVEAASLTNQANSILKYMFYDIIAGKTEMLNPVESYIYEDSMGLCGWINNKRVLLGNRELMINHSIEGLPSLTREKDYTENGKVAVYLSISGELSAMFVIEITTNNEVKHWLQECEANDIYVMLRSVDSIISISKLSELFDVNPDMFKLIPFRLHQKFDDTTTFASRQSGSMCCTGKFSSFASLLISAKRVKKTAMLGVSIQVAAIALGIILSMVMTIISSFTEINISLALIYNFIWFFITLFLQGMRKV